MRRSALITLAALGGLICLIGGTGLFAALTDSARSGTNSLESAPLAGSADIQLADAQPTVVAGTGQGLTCGQFSEDLTSPFFALQNVQPGQGDRYQYCIRNAGSQRVTVSALADELADVELACTGDEELHGDTTCGNNQAGELSGRVTLTYTVVNCTTGDASVTSEPRLADNAVESAVLTIGAVPLEPGATSCFEVSFRNADGSGLENQRAQSDRATWRFKWIAQA